MSKRVCVVGAGVSGLCVGKALSDAGVEYTCFESSDDIGGNWYFGNPNGRSAAYRSLHIDISKPSISLRDFPIPEEFPDFPHHSQIFDYLKRYAAAFGLRRSIRFKTEVEQARPLPEGGWLVSTAGSEERFDALVVCNGHHWDPMYPTPPFAGEFSGAVIHAHDYVDPSEPIEMQGRRVLVVGIGNSAVDITSELSRKGLAERVYISTRSGAWILPKYIFGRPSDQWTKTSPYIPVSWQRAAVRWLPVVISGRPERFGLPRPNHRFLEAHPTVSSELLVRLGSGDAIAKPDVTALLGDRVRFADGTIEAVDVIIYATGYQVSFPFFAPDFIAAPGNELPLYKRIFKPGVEDLAFVGLAQVIPTGFPFAELQAKLVAEWLADRWAPPDRATMEREIRLDERRHAGHYRRTPRHTMQIDLHLYAHDLKRRAIPEGRKRAAPRERHARSASLARRPRADADSRARTVLVTGAARGIGAAIATRLHATGSNVVLLDVDGQAVSNLAARLRPRALGCEVDVTDSTALQEAVVQATARFGGIDVAIANAGIGQVGALLSTPDDAIERTIAVNLLGVWRTNRAVIPQLLARDGYLLNIASLAAATHTAANGAYAASKAAVEALTDALRIELAGTGVAVGCAYFGYIDTELERASVQHPAIQALQRMMPNVVRRPAPVSVAVEAVGRAIERRAPRVYAPRYIAALLAARGIVQPLVEWRTRRNRDLIATLAAEVTAAHNS